MGNLLDLTKINLNWLEKLIETKKDELIMEVKETIFLFTAFMQKNNNVIVDAFFSIERILPFNEKHGTNFNLNIEHLLSIKGENEDRKRMVFFDNPDVEFSIMFNEEKTSLVPTIKFKRGIENGINLNLYGLENFDIFTLSDLHYIKSNLLKLMGYFNDRLLKWDANGDLNKIFEDKINSFNIRLYYD